MGIKRYGDKFVVTDVEPEEEKDSNIVNLIDLLDMYILDDDQDILVIEEDDFK